MKKKIILVAILGSLSGCASWIPAKVNEISEGKYSIVATGNSFASIEKMKKKVTDRALKQCKGSSIEYEKEPHVKHHKSRDHVNGGYQYYKQVTAVISCNK